MRSCMALIVAGLLLSACETGDTESKESVPRFETAVTATCIGTICVGSDIEQLRSAHADSFEEVVVPDEGQGVGYRACLGVDDCVLIEANDSGFIWRVRTLSGEFHEPGGVRIGDTWPTLAARYPGIELVRNEEDGPARYAIVPGLEIGVIFAGSEEAPVVESFIINDWSLTANDLPLEDQAPSSSGTP